MYIGYVYPDGTVGMFPDNGQCLLIEPGPVDNIIEVNIYTVYPNGHKRRSGWNDTSHIVWYMAQGKWAQFHPTF